MSAGAAAPEALLADVVDDPQPRQRKKRSRGSIALWVVTVLGLLYLFAVGGMPTANYITGPTYLLNWGITTTDKVNLKRVRAEAIAFTEMILRLGRTPRGKLRG